MAVEHDRDVEIMVVFDDDDDGCLLSETQKSSGLTRTLLFVNTEVNKTISDLRSYIIHTFHLQNICPNDIYLSINGFSLLPFEQTCKLNNKVIRVKKTTALSIDKVTTGGCQSDINPKKIKASELEEQVRILNTKKPNCTTIEASPIAPQHVENDIHVKQNEHPHSPGSDGSTEINRFSLSPFEPTCSLNGQAICVTKATAVGELLPCDKVTEGCQSDIDRSEDSKKRKAIELEEQVRILNTKKPNCTTIEASPVAPQHVENDIHVKQNEHPDSPGSDGSTKLDLDECLDKLSEKNPLLEMLSEKGLEVEVVGIQILLDKVKDGLKRLDGADMFYYAMKDSKSTETSRNDDPAVEPAVDTQGSNKSMDLDDTKQAQSLENIQPSGGALTIAQGIVAFCKLIPKTMFHPVFKEDIEFNDLVVGIIDGIITTKDLACAHQLFEDKHADKMLWSWYDDDEE